MSIDMDPYRIRNWKALIEYWKAVRGNCARCGGPIDYDGPRFRVFEYYGKRITRQNPWSLDVGHKSVKDRDPRTMWAPIDTQPEHARCNRAAGAAYGNRKRGAVVRQRLKRSREW